MNIRILLALALALTIGVLANQTAQAQDEGGDEAAAEEAVAAAPGQATYEEKCSRCHNDNGDAQTRMGERNEIAPFTAERFAELGLDGVREAIVSGHQDEDDDEGPLDGYDAAEIDAVAEYTLSLVQ